jgi:hypothetical protein
LTPPSPADRKGSPQAQTEVPPTPNSSPSKDAGTELTTLARQAFQERRRKDCLVLTRAILAIDPENKEAQVIENWVRLDLQKDVEDARAVIQQASLQKDGELLQRAEWMLRMILRVDQSNEQANTLLQTIRTVESESTSLGAKATLDQSSTSETSDSSAVSEETNPDMLAEYPGYPPTTPSRRGLYLAIVFALALPVAGFALWKYGISPTSSSVAGAVDVGDTPTGVLKVAIADGIQVFINGEYRGTTPMEPLKLTPGLYKLKYQQNGKEIGHEEVTVQAGNTINSTFSSTFNEGTGSLVFIVVPASGVQLKIDGKAAGLTPESAELKQGEHQLEFSAVGYASKSVTARVTAGQRTTVPVLLKPLGDDDAGKPKAPAVPLSNTARAQVGQLAVSSPVAVDIFEGNKRLGSTPAIVELSPGPHILEFHHGDLKKTATYNVEAGVSTPAKVSFEISTNINVYPFAEVFIDGDPLIRLGDTPINKVSVPVGATLIFRHPNYPEKRHRVVSTDTTISDKFP